jgi:hypothetical protein
MERFYDSVYLAHYGVSEIDEEKGSCENSRRKGSKKGLRNKHKEISRETGIRLTPSASRVAAQRIGGRHRLSRCRPAREQPAELWESAWWIDPFDREYLVIHHLLHLSEPDARIVTD